MFFRCFRCFYFYFLNVVYLCLCSLSARFFIINNSRNLYTPLNAFYGPPTAKTVVQNATLNESRTAARLPQETASVHLRLRCRLLPSSSAILVSWLHSAQCCCCLLASRCSTVINASSVSRQAALGPQYSTRWSYNERVATEYSDKSHRTCQQSYIFLTDIYV